MIDIKAREVQEGKAPKGPVKKESYNRSSTLRVAYRKRSKQPRIYLAFLKGNKERYRAGRR